MNTSLPENIPPNTEFNLINHASKFIFRSSCGGWVFEVELVQDIDNVGTVRWKWRLYERARGTWDAIHKQFGATSELVYLGLFNNLSRALATLYAFCNKKGITLNRQ